MSNLAKALGVIFCSTCNEEIQEWFKHSACDMVSERRVYDMCCKDNCSSKENIKVYHFKSSIYNVLVPFCPDCAKLKDAVLHETTL